jgi:hypothetical protein
MYLKENEQRVRAGRPMRAAECVNLHVLAISSRVASMIVECRPEFIQQPPSPYFLPFLSLPAVARENSNRSTATAMPTTFDTKSIRCLVSSNFSCVMVKRKRLFSDSCRATDKFSPIRVQELKFAVANICCSLVMGGSNGTTTAHFCDPFAAVSQKNVAQRSKYFEIKNLFTAKNIKRHYRHQASLFRSHNF